MRVEILKTLKIGRQIWRRGTVLDDTVAPIPNGILIEAARGTNTVKKFPEPKVIEEPKPIDPIETSENFNIPDEETYVSENFIVPEEEESPEAATENPDEDVVAETDDVSFITKEIPTKHLPELEGLIHAKGTISIVAKLLGVAYPTIGRWRKGAMPKPDMVKKIKQEYEKLMRPRDDQL